METDTILQIDDACIAFGEDILFSGFCLQLHEEEIACISGQSGRGKSSLLNAILGFTTLLARDSDNPAKVREYTKKMEEWENVHK